MTARIRAADGLAPPGQDGEIQVRGAHVFTGYWNDPAATAAAFTPDGWFRTGDIGCRFDEAAIIAHARTVLAGFKCPKRVFHRAELPRNQLGKIIRGELR